MIQENKIVDKPSDESKNLPEDKNLNQNEQTKKQKLNLIFLSY